MPDGGSDLCYGKLVSTDHPGMRSTEKDTMKTLLRLMTLTACCAVRIRACLTHKPGPGAVTQNTRICVARKTACRRTELALAISLLAGLPFLATNGITQEIIQGSLSGTIEGRLFIAGDATVAAGHTLTISPGSILEFPPSVSFTVHGRMMAIGTEDRPIVFRPRVDGATWQGVRIEAGGGESQLMFCQFQGAVTGVFLHIYADGYGHPNSPQMNTYLSHCSFSDCTLAGIRGQSNGGGILTIGGAFRGYPQLNPSIYACTFDNCQNGCLFTLTRSTRHGEVYGAGIANPIVSDCVFKGIASSALEVVDSGGTTSKPVFAGNLILGAAKGFVAPSVVDGSVINNVLFDTPVLVQKAGIATTDSISGNVVLTSDFSHSGVFSGPGFVPNDTYGKTEYGFSWGGYAADPFKNVFIVPDQNSLIALLIPPHEGRTPTAIFSWIETREQNDTADYSRSINGPWDLVHNVSAWGPDETTRLFLVKETEGTAWFARIPR